MLKPKCFSLALSLLFLLLPSTSASPSFTNIQNHFFSPNLTCIQGEFYNCSSTCPCYISQDYYHFTTIGVSFVTLIWCTLFLLAFIYVNELREKPGETIFMATLANLFLSVSFGIQNAKLLANDDNNDVRDNDRSCVVLGFFTAFFVNMISVYQFVFYAYNMMTLRKPINVSRLKRSRYHAFAIIVTLLLTFSELGFGNLGRTLLGTCSVKTTSNYLFPIATTGALFLLECIVALMMKRNFRKRINDLNTKQTRYVEHYLNYIIVLCIILLAIGAVAADIAIRVNSELTERTLYQNKDAFNTLQVCSFLLINLIPVLLVIGRIRDPSIWKPLKRKIVSCWSSDEQLEEESHVEQEPQSPEPIVLTMNENPREDGMKKKLLDMDTLPVMNLRPLNSVSPIRLNNPSTPSPYASSGGSYSPKFGKTSEDSRLAHPNQVSKTKDPHMFYSILAGVHYYWHLKKTKQNEGEQQEEEKRGRKDAEYFNQEAARVTKFTLHDTLMRHTMPQIYREIKSKHYKIRFGVFTAYAPQLFADLVELDDIATELQSSLELMQNFSNVVSAGTEINKSQFLTYNSKFIVRNITKGDRRALMKILPRYMQHLKTKPYSLLTRIYGLFRFETMSPYQQVNWLIMKNITERSSNSIERMYEVKGVAAQHRRSLETIGTDGERAVLRALGSLGDEYFEKNEHSIYVDPNIKNPLLETLRQDVEFLISEGLYDYSLNVSIMSRAKTSLNQRLSSSVILEVEERLEAWSLVGEESVLRNQRNWDEEGKSHGEITSSKALTRNRMGTSLVSQVNMQNPFFAIKSTKENLYYCLEIDSYLKPFDWKKKMAYYIKGCKDDGSCLQPPAVYGRRLVEYVTQIVSDKESMFGIINRDSHSHTRSENSSIEEKYNNIIEK